MAEEAKKEKAEKKSSGGGGNKLLIIVIVLLLVILAAVGGLAAYVFTSAPKGGVQGEKTAEAKPKKKHDGPPIFEKLDPFVVNLAGSTNSMLQVEMQAELDDEAARQKFKDYTPKIRSALILLLSSKTANELGTPEGKVKLRAQIKKIINESMDSGGDSPVDSVLFTSFIIQQQ